MATLTITKHESCCSVYEIISLLKALNIKFVQFLPCHMKEACFLILVRDLRSLGIEPVMIARGPRNVKRAREKGIKYISSESIETYDYSLWLSSAIKFSEYKNEIDTKKRALWWRTNKGIVGRFICNTGKRILLNVTDSNVEKIIGVYD